MPDPPADRPHVERGPVLWLVLVILTLFAAVLMVRQYLGAVVLALTLGYLLQPIYGWLASRLPRKWPAAAIVLLMVAVIIFAPMAILGIMFFQEASEIADDLESREDVEQRIGEALSGLGVPDRSIERAVERIVQEGASYLQQAAVPLVTLAADFAVGLVIFFILLFYMLVDGRRFAQYISRSLPAPREEVDGVLQRIGERVKAILYGTVGVALVQGLLAGLGWWVLGLPAPVFWGFVMLLLSVVPLIGAFIVLLPAAVWAFMQGDVWVGVGLLVLNFVMVGLIDDVLRPYMIGRRSNVHPALILLGIVGGLPLFGLAGIILGPLLMGILAPLWEAWARPQGGEVAA